MSGWEKPYMRKLAEIATANAKQGRILELGFGLGISAGFIQENAPYEHVIIEMNREIAMAARSFGDRQASKVTILEGFWGKILCQTSRAIVFRAFCSIHIPYPKSKSTRFFIHSWSMPIVFFPKGGVLTYYSDEATWFSQSTNKR